MMELTFQPGTSSQCASVIVNDDSTLENNEIFLVELTTADEAVQLNPTSANITIIDNDSKTVPTFMYIWHDYLVGAVYLIFFTQM